MAPACVLDASAAVRLIVGDPARADLVMPIREAALVLAPEWMLTEVANILRKRQWAACLITADRRLGQLAERVLA